MPSPGHLPHPGIEPTFLLSPVLTVKFFATSAAWEGLYGAQSHRVRFLSRTLVNAPSAQMPPQISR